jgi:hypothetical protein
MAETRRTLAWPAEQPRPNDKLFLGCKLPAFTPPGQWFEPDWRTEELAEMSLFLSAGLDQLESELQK